VGRPHGRAKAGGRPRPPAAEAPTNASGLRRHSWNVNRSDSSIPDRELVELVVRDGDETAFRLLYRRHAPGLAAFVRRYAPDGDVEDVAQEAWLRAVRALPSFRWDSTFRTWLIGIGFNAAREATRRVGSVTPLPADGASLLGRATPPPNAPGPADRIDLERAIRELPPGYRAVLLLHDVEGFTHPEIGRLLDITAGTARSQLHHARRAVRAMLSPKVTHERP
jgi:RNA polymerase sigma-70 factor, ECF subfamily